MKKILVLVVVAVLVMSLAACTPAEPEAPASEAPASEAPASEAPASEAPASEAPASEAPAEDGMMTIEAIPNASVAISLPPADNVWQAKMLTAVEEVIKEYPDITWTIKNAVDDPDQLNQLTSMKEEGYDLIIALPNDGDLMTPICEEIYESGTHLLVLDRDIASGKYTAYVGGDNPGAGRGGAQFLGEYLGGEGKIAVLRCIAGAPSDLDIYNNFTEELKKYPGIEIIVEGDGEYDTQHGLDAMSNILPAYDQIDAVFAQDDEAALGAMTAIENAGRTDIKLMIGIGGKTEAYDQIKADNTIFKCSMTYLPDMGADAVRQAAKMLAGEPFAKDEIIESVMVTKDNVDEYMDKGY